MFWRVNCDGHWFSALLFVKKASGSGWFNSGTAKSSRRNSHTSSGKMILFSSCAFGALSFSSLIFRSMTFGKLGLLKNHLKLCEWFSKLLIRSTTLDSFSPWTRWCGSYLNSFDAYFFQGGLFRFSWREHSEILRLMDVCRELSYIFSKSEQLYFFFNVIK